MARILLITNADAGSAGEATAADAADALRRAGADVEVRAPGGPEELRDVLRHREERDVVVAGGDGSLHAAVAALAALDDLHGTVLGLIPLGTGNDFARAAGIPLDAAAAAEVVLAGRTCRVDLVEDDAGSLVVNAVHVGVGAEAAERAAPYKAAFGAVGLGKIGYAVGAFLAAMATRGWPVDIDVDGRRVCEGARVLQVGIANGRTIGGFAELAPDAEPGDGRVEVIVSHAVGPLSRFRYGAGLARGTHERHRDVVSLAGRTVTIRARNGARFRYNADGELSEPVAARTWTVRPAAVSVRLPR